VREIVGQHGMGIEQGTAHASSSAATFRKHRGGELQRRRLRNRPAGRIRGVVPDEEKFWQLLVAGLTVAMT